MKQSLGVIALLAVLSTKYAYSYTPCQKALIAAAPVSLLRIRDSRLQDKFLNAYATHRLTAILLSYLSEEHLEEFYGLAATSDEQWSEARAKNTVTEMTEWFPQSQENQEVTLGDFKTTEHASAYLQLLGLNGRTLSGFPVLPDDLQPWRKLRRFHQTAILDSFFWPDHGFPHTLEILLKADSLSRLLTTSQRERYAFLLSDDDEGTLWRQRLRIAAFVHDIVALSHREGHAYHANGYAHLALGDILFDNQYQPFASPVPDGFWDESSLCGLIALLHSKSSIPTDEMSNFLEILRQRKAEAFGRVFGSPPDLNLTSPIDVGLQMVAIPEMSDEERDRVAKAGEVLRMLDAHRTRGPWLKNDAPGLMNTAGYKFQIRRGKVFLDINDFGLGPRLLPLPPGENFFLYGQVAMRSPKFTDAAGPNLEFQLMAGGKTTKETVVRITNSEPFKKLLRAGQATRAEICRLSADEKIQSILKTILDIAFEYARPIRENLTFSFEL